MIDIRPATDLRDRLEAVEQVLDSGNPVFLTKDGYGSMVAVSMEMYARLTNTTPEDLQEQIRAQEAT